MKKDDPVRQSVENTSVTLARHTRLGGDRMQVLEEVAVALTRQDDFETALRIVAACSVPRFADLVTVVVRGQGEDRLEVAHRNPEQNPLVAGLIRPLLPTIRRLAEKDVRQGRQFRWIPRVARSSTPFLTRDADLLGLLQALEVASILVVPLRSNGGFLGGIAFMRGGGATPYQAADLAAAQVIARRAATAIQETELNGRALDEQSRRSRLEGALQKWIQVFDHAGWGAAIVDGQDQRIEAVNPSSPTSLLSPPTAARPRTS